MLLAQSITNEVDVCSLYIPFFGKTIQNRKKREKKIQWFVEKTSIFKWLHNKNNRNEINEVYLVFIIYYLCTGLQDLWGIRLYYDFFSLNKSDVAESTGTAQD